MFSLNAKVSKLKVLVAGTRRRLYISLAVLLLTVLAFGQLFNPSQSPLTDAESTKQVSLMKVADLQFASNFSVLGTVEAVSEVELKAETGGRVTALNTDLGRFIPAGFVLAQFENSRERAALIQAQGAYEAAVAGAAVSNSSVKTAELALDSAKTALSTAQRNSHTAIVSILTGTVDQFFGNPTSDYPGVRVTANSAFLNNERVILQGSLPVIQSEVATFSDANHQAVTANIITTIKRVLSIIDEIVVAVERDGDTEVLAGLPLSSYATDLYAARTTLNSLMATLENAEQSYLSAKEALARTQLGGTDANVSVANAQIKIALGSLRAAEANYEKTLVRTPISGTVNALHIKVGDTVSPQSNVALVANNNGLQVTAAINDSDRSRITVGDVVTFDNQATGTITAIGGAVDPTSGKIALKISVNDASKLTAGTAVTAYFTAASTTPTAQSPLVLSLPLTAIKLTTDSALVFTVNNENKLEPHIVTLGRVLGDTVIVESGVTSDMVIVSDARGLKAQEEVEIIAK